MDKAKVAGTSPIRIDLEAGKKYAYCTCGLSGNQPFCDGSHKGTSFVPTVFTAEAAETVSFCCCKQSGRQPRCDGSHRNLAAPSSTAEMQ